MSVKKIRTCNNLICNKQLIWSQKKYCSKQCEIKIRVETKITLWKTGKIRGGNDFNVSPAIRNYLLKKANFKCSKCFWGEVNPYNNRIPLEIDHIDGNWRDNSENNLRVLCPNCHALTEHHRALNKGNGRHTVLKARRRAVYGFAATK